MLASVASGVALVVGLLGRTAGPTTVRPKSRILLNPNRGWLVTGCRSVRKSSLTFVDRNLRMYDAYKPCPLVLAAQLVAVAVKLAGGYRAEAWP